MEDILAAAILVIFVVVIAAFIMTVSAQRRKLAGERAELDRERYRQRAIKVADAGKSQLLTPDERQMVHDYYMTKWLADGKPEDLERALREME